MKKFLSVMIILFLFSNEALGMSKETSGRILDDFNKRQKVMLFENVPFTSQDDAIVFDKDNAVADLQDTIDKLEANKERFKTKKREVKIQKFSLTQAIEDIDNSIKETENSIEDIKKSILDNEKNIEEYVKKMQDLQVKIDSSKKTILDYLSYIYSKGDMVYDGEQVDLLKSIVLNDGNVSDVFNDIYFKSLIEATGQNFIENYRKFIAEYYVTTEELKKQKSENTKLKNRLSMRKNDLSEQKIYKEELLKITKGQEALFNQFLIAQQNKQDSIKEQIKTIDDQYGKNFSKIAEKYNCSGVDFSSLYSSGSEEGENTEDSGTGTEEQSDIIKSNNQDKIDSKSESPDCVKIRQYFELEKKLREYPMAKPNIFSWPVKGQRGISAYYKDPEYTEALGSEHEAVDIRVSQGTDITAPAAGYVYLINSPASGNYAYIALKHADGYVTFYGHVSEVLVKEYDFVKPGQVFAKSGGAKGTPGAGPMTSGAHLHFEVYRYKNSIDPLNYLDLTSLNYNDLPEKYKVKYLRDLQNRYGNRVNVSKYQKFFIEGNSEVERQKNFLAKYATSSFNDWNIWVEESVNAKIDPSFLMCVGLAESSLGNHLKTANNVGNVGNVDSGGTYSFSSPREGIYRMTKTFNNRFLKQYNTMDKLSRWGNQNGPIYASSPENWHNNLVRCISALKGYVIEDNYKFRLDK
ncbi:MAG: peptidoglycan DD-metalloendopeptidase family protein [Candidatus Gracilibacteria bacterium]|nr:peptidoglycan DD-metalloendopeptidase family protein [Candidatus Gracilibacteria bacterium]